MAGNTIKEPKLTPHIKRVHDVANIYILKEIYKTYIKHYEFKPSNSTYDLDYFFQLLDISSSTFSDYASGKNNFGAKQRESMLHFAELVKIDPAVCNGSKLILLKSDCALEWWNTNNIPIRKEPTNSEWHKIEEAYWDYIIEPSQNRKTSCAPILREVRNQLTKRYFYDIDLYRFYIWLENLIFSGGDLYYD